MKADDVKKEKNIYIQLFFRKVADSSLEFIMSY